jgi:catechol 2,3-dioxygenase-like lactoylglutathione lyase family enzyme
MTIGIMAPLFIVERVPRSLAFYRDSLGFTITFEGPTPDDIFFGMVERDRAMIMFKAVGLPAIPNRTRDIGQGIAPWDAYCHTSDPDGLAAEFAGRGVAFVQPLADNSDRLRGFEVQDPDGYVIYFGRPLGPGE